MIMKYRYISQSRDLKWKVGYPGAATEYKSRWGHVLFTPYYSQDSSEYQRSVQPGSQVDRPGDRVPVGHALGIYKLY
jgi:hypothetical protein